MELRGSISLTPRLDNYLSDEVMGVKITIGFRIVSVAFAAAVINIRMTSRGLVANRGH